MTIKASDGRRRVIIEGITPQVDCGRFAAKRTAGDQVHVEADIFTDGHDAIAASLLARREGSGDWTEIPMKPLVNDRWEASFRVSEPGRYGYKILGWVDHFETWRRDLLKRVKAETDTTVDYLIGAELVNQAAERAIGGDQIWLQARAAVLRSEQKPGDLRIHATDPMLHELALRYPDRRFATESTPELAIIVDPVRARFSSWYEFFPRSTSEKPGTHGTFADCKKRLPYIAEMGFNVVYMPPIHPIGRMFRKGPNNNPESQPGDAGRASSLKRRNLDYLSRWILPSRLHRIIPTSRIMRLGSRKDPTEASNMPKIRPRNTRIFILSTLKAMIGKQCGRS